MQTTLLGLGIALILALVAALVGPHFIDWTAYRATFESQLTRLTGLPVRVNGTIEVRLLPVPYVALRDVAAGPQGGELKAGEATVELALGPLLRGEWRASELRLVRPAVALRLDASGHLAWPGAAPALDPDALSIERIAVEDGRIALRDEASGSSLVLETLTFRGDVRSLAGPVKGEGAFVSGGERYGYRLATGRWNEDGLKLKLNLDPADRLATLEADGMLRLENAAPRFEGTMALAQPAAVKLSRGRAVASEPWRASAKVKLGANGGLLEQIELQYGPDERAIKLTGTAQVRLGKAARIDGVISARQIDLDRAFVLPEGTRRVPLAVLRRVADAFGGLAAAPMPVRLGFGIDSITLAGAALQTVRGDVSSDGDAWNVESLEFRAPGITQVRTSARIAAAGDGGTFTGPAVVESSDPKALMGWIEGRSEGQQGPTGPLRASGEIAIATDKVAVERLKAEIDRKAISGRLAYSWAAAARPARLEAELSAASLDVDQALASLQAALAGTTLDPPGEVTLAIDVAAAIIAGVAAKDAHAQLAYDANGLVLQRVSVADLGGAALDLTGRIDQALTAPRGAVTVDIDAKRLDGIAAVLAKYAPQTKDAMRTVAPRLAPAKLSALLTVEHAEGRAGSKAELVVTGTAGAARINLTAAATGEPSRISAADVTLNGRIYADDGAALVALLGLGGAVAVDKRPAVLSLTASGQTGELRVEGRLTAPRLEAATSGTLRLAGEAGIAGDLDLKLAAADALLLRPAGGGQAVPVTVKTHVKINNGALAFGDMSGMVAGTGLRGQVDVSLGQPVRLTGRIETEALDLASVAAAAGISMPAERAESSRMTGPFSLTALGDAAAQIEFAVQRATLSSRLIAQDLHGLFRLGNGEASFEDIEAGVGGGHLTGQLTLHAEADGLAARMRLALGDADAAAVALSSARPVVTGRLGIQLEADGRGFSPATLIGSLRGAGTVTLEDARIAGLDAKAFDTAIRAIDSGQTVDAAKIKDMMDKALQAGDLAIARADGAFTIAAGQARWGNVVAHAQGADLTINGVIDLADLSLDARLILAAAASSPGMSVGPPDVFIAVKGPIAAPKRSLDVSALTGWLTLRAVERQSKQLETLQSQRHDGTVGTTPPPSLAPATGALPGTAAPPTASPPASPPPAVPPAASAPPASASPPAEAEPTPPRVAPRGALAPPAEQAPALPPPIEIRPAPEPRANRAPAPRSPEAGSASAAPKARGNGPPRQAADPPPAARRSVLDQLFGPQR